MQRIYGIHAVEALIQTQAESVEKIYLQQNRHDQRLQSIRSQAESSHIPLTLLSRRDLENLLEERARHQGVIAEVSKLPKYTEQDLKKILTIEKLLL